MGSKKNKMTDVIRQEKNWRLGRSVITHCKVTLLPCDNTTH